MHRRPPEPKPLVGFEHVARYWDSKHQKWTAKVLPGEFYVSTQGEMIATVLGSCVSACIRDSKLGIGGMNHFMLPEYTEHSSDAWGSNPITRNSRYGSWAMELLINEILKRGGQRSNLEVKLFGGGQMIASMSDVGQRNILFVYNYLRKEGLEVVKADVGDIYARKLLYFPDTGTVKMRRILNIKDDTLLQRETEYRRRVKLENTGQGSGGVDLFEGDTRWVK